MKTAVEWMANELLYLENEYDMKLINKNEYQAKRKELIEKAKEMEKEQIKDAHKNGKIWLESSEQYYNQTFK